MNEELMMTLMNSTRPTRLPELKRLSAALVLALLAACATTTRNPAPVVERSSGAPVRAPEPVKVTQEAPPRVVVPDGPGWYTVKKGDTLIRIALDHGHNYRDLVQWNNLTNPNDIKVDQVLRVAPPDAASGTARVERVTPVPAADKPASAAASASASSSSAMALVNKNSPRGDKRPYSEATLAELQKPDAGTQKTTVATTSSANPAPAVTSAAGSTSGATSVPAQSGEDGMSWAWPTEGRILAGFEDGKNKGIDIAGKAGQQILAAGSGKVMYAGSVRGYGNLVIVRHSNNLLSAYAHNQAILVKEGQSVQKGQLIAEMGNSDSDAVKLHFEIRQQGKPVDPSRFLPTRQF